MPLPAGTTATQARESLSSFLRETGCYEICARCPVYPNGVGCCHGCGKLARAESGAVLGCGQPNLSCLSYTCAVLDRHLLEQGAFEEWNDLIYGVPREGYRGCEPLPSSQVLEVRDPIREVLATIALEKRRTRATG